MKKLAFLLSFCLTLPVSASSYYYVVEKGDTFGQIMLSLGYLKLWSGSGYINKFRSKISSTKVNQVSVGDTIRLKDSEIIFKKNVEIKEDRIFFKRKIKKMAEWKELMALEGQEAKPAPPESLSIEKEKETVVFEKKSWTLELYPGLGGFVAQDMEKDESSSTTTFTGLQPLAQLKGIYSHQAVGSVALDVLVKKIVNDEFSFPINTDFRFQYLPKWFGVGTVNFALSYSLLKHSYVGQPEDEEKEYELSANFLGIGIVWPRESYWFELYLERALSGETESEDRTLDLKSGWRVDSELVYPLGKKLYLIPGINYYTTENSSESYEMSVLEVRSSLAWLIEL